MSLKLSEILPKPSNASDEWSNAVTRDPWFKGHETSLNYAGSKAIITKEPPPYGQRKGFIPRTPEDFGDGGAFPEVHMAQFPLGMGVEAGKEVHMAQFPLGMGVEAGKGGQSKTVALQFDETGKLRFDAIAKQGQHKDKIVYSRLGDMKSKIIDEDDESFHKPDDEEIFKATEETREALEKITTAKVAAALPVQHAQKPAAPQFIRYTSSQQAQNSAPNQRIIRMVEQQKDPMEPPMFKINQKIPRPPPSPPAPVMHSPTRKVTAKEQADWKIPPCISNWKNPKGFTVPLDKRLAADGRGLQQVHINENFAKMAEALSIAERTAREAVEARSQMERRRAQIKKQEQEQRMREMALNARQARTTATKKTKEESNEEVKERDAIRRDRMEEHRKERNIARSRPDKLERLKKDKERDISEKIALGLPDSRARTGETQFDSRLFNQSKGLDSGGIDDETYAVYDKAWRPQDAVQKHIYRPTKDTSDIYGDDLDRIISTNRFVADKGFSGTEGGGSARSGPVQFEKDEEDIFGLGQLLESGKESKKRQAESGGAGESSSSSKRSRR
uniref:SKI-interacting protein SKIP SNW domain-containing protein n=1 Tax=Acrobeloides nanus TaxID=290746 RepID=A0A914DR83_9BILA